MNITAEFRKIDELMALKDYLRAACRVAHILWKLPEAERNIFIGDIRYVRLCDNPKFFRYVLTKLQWEGK